MCPDPYTCRIEGFHSVPDLLDEDPLNNPTDACHISRNKAQNIKTMKSIHTLNLHHTERPEKTYL
jgi:hypothetical protein